MTGTQAVLFDFGGTLDADGERWSRRFHDGYRDLGGRLRLADFERVFRESDISLARQPGIRNLGFRAMVELQAVLLSRMLPDGTSLPWDRIAERFIAASLRVVRRNSPVLADLARRWRLGVVSNFTGNLRPCLEELELAGLFGVFIDSTLVGREKPDPHPFEAALTALRVTPGAAWMVGDNPEADIRPALALGMRACWLTDPERPTPRGLTPTRRIAHLPELADALEAACTA
jgi:putative hydrolase of the HAD superfamily